MSFPLPLENLTHRACGTKFDKNTNTKREGKKQKTNFGFEPETLVNINWLKEDLSTTKEKERQTREIGR